MTTLAPTLSFRYFPSAASWLRFWEVSAKPSVGIGSIFDRGCNQGTGSLT